ncbi:MAG: sugar phosphate isomerase/epimerase, partial [Pseudomonadota bacterium]
MSQRLEVFTSLWALQPHDQVGVSLPYRDVVWMVKEAGYAGLALDLGAADIAVFDEVAPLLADAGLTPLLVAFPKTVAELRYVLKRAKDIGAPFVDVIGQVTPLTVEGMIPVIRAWIEMAEDEGVPIQFETHRNCITNDLYTTLTLLDAIPEMRLCA